MKFRALVLVALMAQALSSAGVVRISAADALAPAPARLANSDKAVTGLTDGEMAAMLNEAFRIIHTESVRRTFLDGEDRIYVVGDDAQIELLKSLNDSDIIPLSGDDFSKIQSRKNPRGFLRIEFSDAKTKSVSVVLTWFGGRRGMSGLIDSQKRVLLFKFVKKRKKWDLEEVQGSTQ